MYRIWDTQTRKWINDGIYMSPSVFGDLYILKKTIFGNKLVPISDENYVIHKEVNLCDKNGKMVYEGDYIKAQVSEDREVLGLIVYANELSAYIILCDESEEWFSLGSEVCEHIEVVGNVFDGKKEERLNDNEAL